MSAVHVDLTVEIELHDWAMEYDLPSEAAARADLRRALARVAEDWLRENIGFKGASVRVNPNNRIPDWMRS